MARDYRSIIDSLEWKAADKAVSHEEREALLAKADELRERHGITKTQARQNLDDLFAGVRAQRFFDEAVINDLADALRRTQPQAPRFTRTPPPRQPRPPRSEGRRADGSGDTGQPKSRRARQEQRAYGFSKGPYAQGHTHCKNGHDWKTNAKMSSGSWVCSECKREATRRHNERKNG